MLYFEFMWGPKLTEDLVEPKILGDLQSILHTIVVVEAKAFDETAFHVNWLIPNSFAFLFCQIVILIF